MQLERAHEAAERARDLEANRRAILEAYGTGLQLGLYWFPPHLRNQVYAALGLVAWVSPDGLVSIEGSFDANVIRLTREVEQYAKALMEVDERVKEAPLEVVERELSRVRDAQTLEAFAEGGARVTVFDLPEVVELMKERLSAAGISAVGGDFNEGLPEGPFDAAYLGSVSHIYGPEENLALIKRVAGCLSPGGLIAIRDFVRGVSKGAALFAVNMLVNTESGNTYTEEDYRAWLGEAGFKEVEVLPIPARETHFVLARQPA